MRLVDLAPRWVGDYAMPSARQGVSFACPCCRTIRLAVFFDVGVDTAAVDLATLRAARWESPGGDHLADLHVGAVLWHRTGETFDTLTLTPSLDASAFGHWHGYIRQGGIE